MAVPEQTPYSEHTGNGVTKSFALNFDCESKDHLIVLVDEIEPPIATWSLSAGNVVFTTAPAAGKKITVQRNTPFSRNTDYQSYNNSFRPPAVNKDFDWIWLKLQELGVADWILSNRINDLRAYVDKQDNVLQDNIDSLKNYVDDKDDELRNYLLSAIQEQGVALDQLEEYYSYLMQQLAQVAIDRGWAASFIVSADGSTQQQVNDRIGNTWYAKPLGYELNSRVMLTNGDIVKNTVANNIINPNVDMTGWIKTNTASQIFDVNGNSQQEINNTVDAKLNYSIYAIKSTPAEQTTEINTVNTNAKHVCVTDGEYTLGNSMNFYNKAYRYSKNAEFNGGTLYGFNLWDGARINGGTFKTTQGVVFHIRPDTYKFSLTNTVINNTSTSNATAINMSANNIVDGKITGNHITTNGFGILTNDGGANIDGIVIAFNNITSKADPIELNAPNNVVHKNIPVMGNILKANKTDSVHNAGFAVGVAGAKNIPIVGNAIRESRWEAIHIEDKQDTITVTGNVAENCKGDFARIQNGGINGAVGGSPVTVVGNNAKSFGSGLANAGFYNAWDSAGSVVGNIAVGNRFKGFDYGIRGGNGAVIATANLLESASIGLSLEGASHVLGDNTLINTPTAVKSNAPNIVGRINSLSPITTLIDTTGISSGLRVNLSDGFTLFGITAPVTSGGNVSIPLFDEPLLMCGRLIVRVRDGSASGFIYASGDVLYDGNTMTIDKKLSKSNGDMSWSGSDFKVSNGKICINVYSASAKTLRIEVIYRGEYYK